MVERQLPKLDVAGSIPVSRSIHCDRSGSHSADTRGSIHTSPSSLFVIFLGILLRWHGIASNQARHQNR